MLIHLVALITRQSEISIQWGILLEPSVRHELRLTEDQVLKLNDIIRRGEIKVRAAENSTSLARRAISHEGLVFEVVSGEIENFAKIQLDEIRRKRAREITLQRQARQSWNILGLQGTFTSAHPNCPS